MFRQIYGKMSEIVPFAKRGNSVRLGFKLKLRQLMSHNDQE